jgi:hypothetical protein
MSTPSPNNLTVDSARKLLETFSCIDGKTVESASQKALIGQALLLLASLADYQNLGICADTAAEGLLALKFYLKALGYEVNINSSDLTSFEEPVYIKFNGQRQTYYLDSYTGRYRGVLVSCQSSQDESINGTYGYLPLDLFMSEEGVKSRD